MEVLFKKKCHLRSTKILHNFCWLSPVKRRSPHQPRCSTSHHGRIFWAGPRARRELVDGFNPKNIYFRLEIFHRGEHSKDILKPPPSQLYILKSGGRFFFCRISFVDASQKGEVHCGENKVGLFNGL